jgi:hypothetical protein
VVLPRGDLWLFAILSSFTQQIGKVSSNLPYLLRPRTNFPV